VSLQVAEHEKERYGIYQQVPKVGVLEIVGYVCVPRGAGGVAE